MQPVRALDARIPNAGESDMNLDFTRTDYPAGFGPDSVTLGDFNGDGLLDLAVADFLSNTVSVLLGNAGGSFQDATAYVVGRVPSSVAIGSNLSGVGLKNLFVANEGDGTVSILPGAADGTFLQQVPWPAVDPISLAVGDFDGDGISDLAAANFHTDTVSVFFGVPIAGGILSSPTDFATGDGPRSVAIGDLNGDGLMDLAVAN